FDLEAIVLFPDHIHMIMKLPKGDYSYPTRLGYLKKEFTKRWLATSGKEQVVSESKQRAGKRGVWQRRFWEHTCQDEKDLEAHMDYIHYNPVKHGLVRCPNEWE